MINDRSEVNIRHWNGATEEVKQALDKCKSDKWKTSCECLNAETGSRDLWRLIKHIEKKQQKKKNYERSSNILETSTGKMKTDKDVSIDLADHCRNVSKLNFEHKLGLIIQNAMQKQNRPGILMNTFCETELYQAVSNVKPGKAS